MKKRKFRILLNIATLCLCVCAIAFGVYSAKQASLNVSGTIGFNAHDCKVSVSYYMKGYASSPDDEPKTDYDSTPLGSLTNIGDSTTLANQSINLNKFYFSDMAGDTVPPIYIKFVITNRSEFPIHTKINLTIGANEDCAADHLNIMPTINNNDLKGTNEFLINIAKNESKDLEVCLKIYDSYLQSNPSESNISMQLNFAKGEMLIVDCAASNRTSKPNASGTRFFTIFDKDYNVYGESPSSAIYTTENKPTWQYLKPYLYIPVGIKWTDFVSQMGIRILSRASIGISSYLNYSTNGGKTGLYAIKNLESQYTGTVDTNKMLIDDNSALPVWNITTDPTELVITSDLSINWFNYFYSD